MAGSIFAKMRRDAKRNKKSEAEKVKLGQEAPMAEEVTPLTEEELTELLNAATQDMVSEPAKVEGLSIGGSNDQKVEEKEVIKSEKPTKYFTAVGIYYDLTKRKFVRVDIEYNPKTNFTNIVSTEEIADSSATALFKINNYFAMKLVRDSDVL